MTDKTNGSLRNGVVVPVKHSYLPYVITFCKGCSITETNTLNGRMMFSPDVEMALKGSHW